LAAICRSPDANTHAWKALSAQALRDGANPVVARSTAATFHRDLANRTLEIIVDNKTICGSRTKVLQRFANRLARIVHSALGP
jgi:hypothetical protein